MKNLRKVTRVQLKIEHEDDSILLGLVCAEPDYKLSLLINKKLAISLKNISPLRLEEDNNTQIVFSRFTYTDGPQEISYSLISNRAGKKFLLNNLKNVDYIFQVHDSEGMNRSESLTTLMREIDSVNAVFNIDLYTFKDKNLHYLTR
jgi:hypothetical protein